MILVTRPGRLWYSTHRRGGPIDSPPGLAFLGRKEQVTTDLIKTRLPARVGLSSHAIFRLWKTALKGDETVLDEAIASVHEQMTSLDQARAEQVMSLIIRRHRDAKEAFKAMLMAIGTQSWPPTEETLST